MSEIAYGSPSPVRPAPVSWGGVVLRLLLFVLPGQVVGSFAAVTALEGSGVLRDRPGLATLIVVGAGLVAGVAVGLLLRPERRRIPAYAGLAAAVGAAVFTLLLGAAQLRLPDVAPRAPLGAFLRGSLLVAAVQTAVAVPLWWLRSRRRP